MDKLETLLIDTENDILKVNNEDLKHAAVEINLHITHDTIELTTYASQKESNEVIIKKWHNSFSKLRAENFKKSHSSYFNEWLKA